MSVFICYAREDAEWLERLREYLKGLGIDHWYDRGIEHGEEWERAIEASIDKASAVVLLVSEPMLQSSFIAGKELPRIMERRQRDGVPVLPVLVGPCDWDGVPALAGLQILPRSGEALSEMDAASAERALAEAASSVRRRLDHLFDRVARVRRLLRLSMGAVVLVAAIMAVVLMSKDDPDRDLGMGAHDNVVEVLLDGSEHMLESFEGVSKWKAAVDELEGYLYTQDERRTRLAVRVFGGDCDDREAHSALVVGFDDDVPDGDTIRAHVPDGEATLLKSLSYGVGDIQMWRRGFTEPFVGTLSILVFTGQGDTCERGQTETLKREIEALGISVDFHFVVMSDDPDVRRKMEALADDLGGQAHFVTTRRQVSAAAEQVFEEEEPAPELEAPEAAPDAPVPTPDDPTPLAPPGGSDELVDDGDEAPAEVPDPVPTIKTKAPTLRRATAEDARRAVLREFELTGKYVLMQGEALIEGAEIYHSKRAAAFLLLGSGYGSPLLVMQRTRTTQSVAVEEVLAKGDESVVIRREALLTDLGKFRISGGDVVIELDDFEIAMVKKPPLLGWHVRDDVLEHTPEYGREMRYVTLLAKAVKQIAEHEADVRVDVYMGTWSPSDSRLLPGILRLEEALAESKTRFRYYGVPRPPAMLRDEEVERSSVRRVPTGLVYSGDRLVGRIVAGEWERPARALWDVLFGTDEGD